MSQFSLWFLSFFFYSIIGYIFEVCGCSIRNKRLILSRGYLIGPYLPIFGTGAILMILLLNKYEDDILALFILSIFVCCLLEYITSFILEKIFKLRWWDYSNRKFNINGRVCLENGIIFGIGGVLLIKYIHPTFIHYLNLLSFNVLNIITIILLVLFVFDFFLSTFMVSRLKINIKNIKIDSTEIIRDEIFKSLKKYRAFQRRILLAFPNMLKDNVISAFKKYLDE